VWCATVPKGKWAIATRGAVGRRGWLYYLLAGLMAAAFGGFVCLVLSALESPSFTVVEVWKTFSTRCIWILMPFVTAFVIAFHLDNAVREQERGLRIVEALSTAMALAGAAVLVHLELHEPPLFVLLPIVVSIGLTLGYLVPAWYRADQTDREHEAEAAVEDALVAPGT